MLRVLLATILTLISVTGVAAGNSGITYQGRILKPDGSPLAGANVQFRMQIRTPNANNCLMYEEVQAQDMRNSAGLFSLTINDGSGSRTDTTGLGLDRIFANRGAFSFSSSTCATGSTYTPTDGDGRNLVVLFKDETMSTWEPIPASKINYVPYAFSAEAVQGFAADSLLRVVNGSGDPLTGVAPLSNTQYAALLALASGTSTAYTKSGELNGVALPAMTTGEVLGWNGSAWVSQASTAGPSSITTAMIQGGAVTAAKLDPAISISTTGTVASAVTTTRDFKIYATSPSTFYVGMLAPALASSYTLTWPLNAGTSGQVLTTNGSGVLSWTTPSSAGITALTGDVTASGPGSAAATVASVGGSTAALVHSAELAANAAASTNTVSTIVKRDGSGDFAAGAVTQTSSVYKDSGSNTVTVQAPASITSSYVLKYPAAAASSAGQVLTSDTSGNLSWSSPLTSSTAFVQGGNTFGATADLGTNDAFDLRLRTNGATAMTVKSGGKVGVGTTAPAYLLDVNGSGRFGNTASHDSSHTVLALDSNAGANSGIEISGGRGTGAAVSTYLNFYNGSTDIAEINVWTGSTANKGALAFSTTGTSSAERMRIDESGNVGIATSVPQAKLHVVGSTRLEGNTTAYNGATLQFSDSGLDRTTTLAHINDADFRISTSNGPISLMPGASNNVGIGTTSPVTKLEVAGSVRVGDGGETCDGTITGAIRYNGGNLAFCNGTTWSTLGVAGSGITALTGDVTASGTGSVAATVATVGGYSAANVAAGATLANAATNANTPSAIIKRDGSGNYSANEASLGSIKLRDGASNILTMTAPSTVTSSYTLTWPAGVAASSGQALTSDTSGNLSWTTISGAPTGAAGGDLSGTYPNPAVATVGTSTAALVHSAELAANAATAAGTAGAIVKRDGSGNFTATDVTTSSVKADSLKLNNAGSVVNVVNPIGAAYTFTLPTTVGSSGQVMTTDGTGVMSWTNPLTSASGFAQGGNSFGAVANLGTNDNFDLRFKTNNATAMTITSAGKVGIGSTAPVAMLDIAQTTTNPSAAVYGVNTQIEALNSAAGTQTITGGLFQSFVTAGNSPNGSLIGSKSSTLNGAIGTTTNVVGAHNSATHSWTGTSTNLIGTKSEAIMSGTGTVANMSGVYGHATQLLGNVTNLYAGNFVADTLSVTQTASNVYGVRSEVVGNGGATFTNAYGVYAAITPNSGTITNRYGIYAADAGNGTNFYNFYSEGANTKNYFAGNIGVGTTSPSAKLDVKGTLALSGSTSGAVKFTVPAAAGTATYTWPSAVPAANGYVLSSTTAGVLSWAAAAAASPWTTQAPGINYTAGNVGIGTTSPADLLVVAKNQDGTTRLAVNNPSAGGSATSEVNLTSDIGNFAVGVGSNAYLQGTSYIWNNSNTDMEFGTNNTMRMAILANGRVGVKTAAPQADFDVYGSSVVSGSVSGYAGFKAAASGGSTIWTLPTADGTSGQLLSTNGAGILSWTSASGTGDFKSDGSVSMTGVMKIADGTAAAPSFTYASDPDTGIYHSAGDRVTFASAGLKSFEITGSSNGYISGGKGRFAVGTAASPTFGFENDTTTGIYGGGGTLGISVAGVARQHITATGNIGIGTTAPNAKLDVKGSIVMSGATSGYTGFAPAAAAGSTVWTLPAADGTSGQVLSTNGAGILSWSAAGSGGDFKKDGSVSMTGSFKASLGTLGAPGITFAADPTSGIYSDGLGNVRFVAGGNENLTVQSGSVFTPVSFTANGTIQADRVGSFTDGTSTAPTLLWTGDSNTGFFHPAADTVSVSTNGTERVRVNATGNVGIGTTAPTQALEVNGSVLASAYLYSSDRRLKKDITPLERSLEKLLTLNTVKFNWIEPKNKNEERTQIGLIAQDVQKVFPEAVTEDSQGWLRMNYQALISPLIDGMREMYHKISRVDAKTKALEVKVSDLEAKNKALEERLSRLEKSLDRQPASNR